MAMTHSLREHEWHRTMALEEGAMRLDEAHGVLSPAQANSRFAQSVVRSAAVANTHRHEALQRTCDFDAPDGPFEVGEEDWDGVSVWIGNIPPHGVYRVTGERQAHAALSGAIFGIGNAKHYGLSDDLADELNSFGEGLDADRTVVFQHQRTWAAVAFCKRKDAEACLSSDIGSRWLHAPPSPGAHTDTGGSGNSSCSRLLLKRAITVEQAQAELEYHKTVARKRREAVELSIARIHSWLKRSRRQLSEIFSQIDTDSSGDVDTREFRAGLLQIGLTFEDDEIAVLFSHIDSNGSGRISIDEFTEKIDQFSVELSESAGSILLHLCMYLDREKKTLADVFRGVDVDGSGDLTRDEFHDALVGIGIPHKPAAVEAVMDELDMDGDQSINLIELSTQVAVYRRNRRAFVAKVFNQCFEYLRKSGTCATQIFSRVDVDGSGELDLIEFQESMRKMGQNLTSNEAVEIMAELDLDGSGTIGVSEFLDKLKQVRGETEERLGMCKKLFREADDDSSGFLEESEVAYVAGKLGLSDMVSDPLFVKNMIVEMESMYNQQLEDSETAEHRGTVNEEEFTHWFMEIGVSYLAKPKYSQTVNLEAPSDEEVQHMFEHVDVDKSGTVDLVEVQEELRHLWPFMDSAGFQRGFQAADLDNSGHIDLKEFRHLIAFIVWLNEHRHSVQELEEAFSDGVGEAEFYCGCMRLAFHCGDTEAKFLFEQHCKVLGLVNGAIVHSSQELQDIQMSVDQFIAWAARYACVTLKGEAEDESPTEIRARQIAFLSKELESMAGEYGDVHMIDLVSVMTTKKTDFAHANIPTWKQALTKGIGAANECSQLLAAAFKNNTQSNEGFPKLMHRSVTAIVQMCTREEYFAGQNVITQGETDGRYFVLRRGMVEIHINGVGKVGQMDWGMGFGEIGLLLNTKRTATVKCATPCELYVLERADYETVVSMLPREQRLGPLVLALDKFWELMTGPDGSRRESVDYKSYLKAHLRLSKTLTANSDVDDFDEEEERAVAQSDWAEDCTRYGLKVTESLSKAHYYDAMYQLVELWSGEQQLSYATFLEWVFENICYRDGDHYRFKKIGNVDAVGDKFETMREEARTFQEAQQAAAAEVLAAAEEARRLHVEQQKELARQKEEAKAQARARQIATEERLRESDELGAERAELTRRLAELEAEETELRRRLESGELTLEEAAKVRARLELISAERLVLMARLEENQLNVKLASLDQSLTALAAEEADLQRRLASGKLTAEEETDVRRRLAAIASERKQLLLQRAEILADRAQAAANVVDANFALQLAAIDAKIRELDDEEAELLRRLAEGGLSAAEEREIRARLEAIAVERTSLLVQRYEVSAARANAWAEHEQARYAAQIAEMHRRLENDDNLSDEARSALQFQIKQLEFAAQLSEIQHKLSMLGAEEKELRRRLAAGGLSVEEEAEIRKRLAAIDSERRRLLKEQLQVYRAEEAALDAVLGSGSCAVLNEDDKKRMQLRLKSLLGLIRSAMDIETDAEGPDQDGDTGEDRYKMYLPILTHEMSDLSGHKLSAEEISMLRQQQRADRRARRQRELQQAAAIQLATTELTRGGSEEALVRQQRLAEKTAAAAREQQWEEFDASRLTPQQLAEWNHLRSMLRVSGSFGRGRALAWLGKVMREMNLRDRHCQNDAIMKEKAAAHGVFAGRAAAQVSSSDVCVEASDAGVLPAAATDDQSSVERENEDTRRARRCGRKRHRRKRKGGNRSTGAQQHAPKATQSKTHADRVRGNGAVSAPPIMHRRAPALPARLPHGMNRSHFGGTTTVAVSLSTARREVTGNHSGGKSNGTTGLAAAEGSRYPSQQLSGQSTSHLPPLEPLTVSSNVVRALSLQTELDLEHSQTDTTQYKSAPAAYARLRDAQGLPQLPWESKAAGMLQLDATSRYNVRSGSRSLPQKLSRSAFQPPGTLSRNDESKVSARE